MKHYKHDFERFRKATTRLNSDEKMIYLHLMWYLYEEESPLPKDTDELEYIAYSNDLPTIQKVIKLFFEETPDGYVHEYVRRQDTDFWKSPKKLVEEYIFEPKFRYGEEKTKNYTKGVK